MVEIERLEGKKLLGTAGRHSLVLDRKLEDGGGDCGFTSGEMLQLAIGACAAGSVRNFLEERGLPARPLRIRIAFAAREGGRDDIVIALQLPRAALSAGMDAVAAAACSGGVVSRIRLGSTVLVECEPIESGG